MKKRHKQKRTAAAINDLTANEAYVAGKIIGTFEALNLTQNESAFVLGKVAAFLERGRAAQQAVDAVLLQYPADNS